MKLKFSKLNIVKTLKRFQGDKRTWLAVLAVVVLAMAASFYFFRNQSPEAVAGWWDEDWHYRMKMTVDATKIDSDLTNFPVAIVLTTSNFTYANAQSAGQDIRFTDANGNTLYHEIEKWNSSATSTIWVKVPMVDDTTDTTLYMYYGNLAVADGQNKTAVWDEGFVMVQHMNNTATGTDSFVDATKYNNHGTGAGSGTSLVATSSGIIDGAFEVDGIDDRVEVPNDSSLSGMSQLTMSGWVYFDQLPSVIGHEGLLMVKRHEGEPYDSYYLDIVGSSGCASPNVMLATIKNQVEGTDYKCANTSLTANQWYYIASTWDGSNIHFYLNGVNDDYGDTTFSGTSVFVSDGILYINSDDSTGGRIDGKIDDVRISKIARPAAWLRADYYNGINNLLTLAAEEKGPGPVAYWGFEEGYGNSIADLSGNGHTLTASSTVWKTDSECLRGKCLYFDGTTSVATTTNTNALNISGSEITLTSWFKPITFSGKKMLLDKGSYAVHWNYGFGLNNSGLLMRHNNGDKTTNNVTLGLNEWHQFTAVYSGGNDYFYIDGVLVESMSDTSWSENTGTQQLTLGAAWQDGVGYSEFFHGYLDEVKVYNYAKTADQVKTDYNKNMAVMLGTNEYTSLSDGLLLQWQMDEQTWNGTSGEVKDSSGSGNHGTADSALATSTAKFNRAGNLDGDTDMVNINPAGTNLANLATSSVTMSIWLKTNTVVKSFADISNTGGSTQFLHLVNDHDIVRAYFYLNGDGTQKVLESDSGSITVGQWYHMAVTRDYQTGDTILYLDGVEVDRLQAIGTTGYAPTNIGLGNGSNYCFDGQLDDFRIYNRALSPDEVRRLSEWAPGPVTHWKMDETSWNGTTNEVKDSSVNGLHGESTGSGTYVSPLGKYGSAGYFDGTSYLDFGNPSGEVLDPGMRNFTFSTWIKTSNTANARIFEKRASGYDGFEFGIGTGGNWMYFIGDNTNRSWSDSLGTAGILSDDQWHHVAYVVDRKNSIISFYKDGILNTTSSISIVTGHVSSTANFILGTGFTNDYIGKLDDVRIYNYARNQRQILEDMNAGRKNNPIGYWSFDEGQGGTAHDSSYLAALGSGNNGTLINMTTSGPSSVWSPSGKAGKALQFDGSDDVVTITNNNITNYNQSRSVSLWFKTNTLGSQKGIIGTGNTVLESAPFWLLTQSDSNKISLYHSGYYDGTTTLERNKWYHLVYTYDRPRNYLVLYLDGKVEYAGTANEADNNKNNIYIGGGWGGYFNGQIDEVKIYNYPITVDEIRQNYNVGQQIVLSRSANDNLTDGLLAYWPMDGDLTDASGNGNTGTASGATATTSAMFGQAYAINAGTNYISVPTSASLDSYTDKLTVSGWYYFNTLAPTQQWLFDKGLNYYLRVTSAGGFTNYLFGINNEDYWSTQNSLVTAGEWYYIVFTYDGQERKLYINGELKESKADTGTIDNGGNLTIGNRAGHSEPMDGQVDDIKIYNRVLSADEIAQNYVNTPGPVAYWKMDEGTGQTSNDSSNYNNTLRLGLDSRSPSWQPIGKIGSALNFNDANPEDWAGASSTDSLNIAGKITLEAWVRLRSYDGYFMDVVSKDNSSNFSYWLGIDNVTARPMMILTNDGSTQYQAYGAEALEENKWYHLAGVYDGSQMRVYVNGVLASNGSSNPRSYSSGIYQNVNSDVNVGYSQSWANNGWDGDIDEVKIYNYARTQRQILEDMNAGRKNNPVAYWKFDEGSGEVIHDFSGNSHNGTLIVGSGGTQSATSSIWTNGLSGKINGSLNFDGTDDIVNMGTSTAFNIATGTVSVWFNLNSHTILDKTIIGKDLSGGNNGDFNLRVAESDDATNPSKIEFKTENGGSSYYVASDNIAPTNEWVHVAVLFGDGGMRMYVNGILQKSTASQVYGMTNASANLFISASATGNTDYFNGKIDEAKIYNYHLTPEEIKQEYNGGFSSYFR